MEELEEEANLLLECDLESLLLLLLLLLPLELLLLLLLPLDRLLLPSRSSPPSPFFPSRSFNGTMTFRYNALGIQWKNTFKGTGGFGGFTTTLTELASCLAGGES